MKVVLILVGWLAAAAACAQTAAPAVQLAVQDVSCAGRKDGQIELTLIGGSLPVDFQWANLNTGALGIGQFTAVNQPLTLPNLAPGLYQFNFTGANNQDTTLQRIVTEPLPLQGELIVLANANGFQVTCAQGSDGVVLFDVKGGTLPHTFIWSNGDKGVRADSLPAGPVSVEVTDQRGCTLQADTILKAPAPILADVVAEGETCFNENTGSIELVSVSGGIPPYVYYLNNDPPSSQIVWDALAAGQYFLYIEDGVGCIHTEGIVLPSGTEFTLKLGPDQELFSGDTLRLSYFTDPPADTLIWEPAQGVRLLPGNEVLLFPLLSTTYHVTGVNADGCTADDVLRLTVNRDRDTYVPNVLSPAAQNSENRYFTVYGGGGIRGIDLLQVYDRFGRLWFEGRDLPANAPASGWDGRSGTDEAPSGVYLWRAVVSYTDGREVRLQGDVTVLR
ncbi:MAG: hypothetical protein EP344_17960 [Bacteroidetes bacterium]|nr:MAG: hypothetical protein EP344_17960 [Bacteroidota bacterium]